MSDTWSTITGLVVVLLLPVALLAQIDSGDPRNPDVLPSQLTPPQPRVFQVYGGVSTLWRDSIKIVNGNGDSVMVDTVRRRTQTVSSAPSTSAANDTLYMYSTVGLLVLDRLESDTAAPAPFSGREAISDTMVDLHRYLGFWLRMDVLSSVPDPDNPVVTGPAILAWPNPFTDVIRLRIARGQFEDIEAYAYSLDGRLLARLPQESADDDGWIYTWDGKGPDGLDVASGTYLVRLLGRLSGSSQRIGFTAKIMRYR